LENGYCSFTGTANVSYGVSGGNYLYGSFTNGANCVSSTFGGDPDPMIQKSCSVCKAPTPTATLTLTGWVYTNSPGPVAAYTAMPFALNWSSTNATSCTIDGKAETPVSGGTDSSYTAGGGGYFHTYILSCSGAGGTATSQVVVTVPPNPTNVTSSCVYSSGSDTLTFSWTLPMGYPYAYPRVYDQTTLTYTGLTQNDYQGTSISGSTSAGIVPGHSYSLWVHTDGFSSPGHPWSDPISPSANPITCPAAVQPSISLSPSTMSFSGVSGGSAPAGQTLTVSNPGVGSTLKWKVATDQTWCHASPATGTAPNGSPSSVTITMDAPSNTGVFNCNVTVSDNGSTPAAGNSPQGIVATYTVKPSDTCSGSGCGSCSGGLCGGGGSSSNSVAASGATCPSTGVTLSWTPAQGTSPITYNIYRNTTGSSPSAGNLLSASPVSGISYTDPVTSAGPYYYWVQSSSGSQTSPDKVAGNTNSSGGVSPTLSSSCSGSGSGGVANLLTSDKDIIARNGTAINYPNSGPQSCNATTDSLPSNVSLNVGDSVTFQINLCNSSSANPASQIQVTDNMTNLQRIPGSSDWGARYNGTSLIYDGTTNSGQANHYYVIGSAPNQTLVFNLSSPADNIGVNSAIPLTYQAQLITPPGASGNSSRFMNSFTAVFNPGSGPNQSVTRSTPYIPFYIGNGGPSIQEIP
jgi:hypothetical protein